MRIERSDLARDDIESLYQVMHTFSVPLLDLSHLEMSLAMSLSVTYVVLSTAKRYDVV